MIGMANCTGACSEKMEIEQAQYQDLALLQVPDTYETLTEKLLGSFQYFVNESAFTYLLKVALA